METVWDWVTVICFGGLVVLMLQRSIEERHRDHLMDYLFPALGCGAANYLGNHYSDLAAVAALALVAVYVFKVLKFPAIGPNRVDRNP